MSEPCVAVRPVLLELEHPDEPRRIVCVYVDESVTPARFLAYVREHHPNETAAIVQWGASRDRVGEPVQYHARVPAPE